MQDSRKHLTSLHIPSLGYRLLPQILAGLKLVKKFVGASTKTPACENVYA
jgi:hypothetical protein